MAYPTRADIDELLRQRLAEDPAFRDRLTEDPRAALGELIGMPIPDAVVIDVHEESLTHVHLVLPVVPGGEISEDDLEMVGGGGPDWYHACGF